MRKCLGLFLVVIFLTGCVPGFNDGDKLRAPETPTSNRAVTPSAIPEVQKGVRIRLQIRGKSSFSPELEVGSTVVVEQVFEPESWAITRKVDGSVYSTTMSSWKDAPITEMRTCLALDEAPCTLGAWQPFQKTGSSELKIDWLGPRKLRLMAEFRDANQGAIPGLRQDYGSNPPPGTAVFELVGVVLPSTALEKLPSPVLTALAATRASAPKVSGSVSIEDGRCCAGGVAGSTITLHVGFKAASPDAKVTEMRVQTGGGCYKNEPALNAAWEPFQESKTYQTSLMINWVGWWINVQYRDAAGNLSAVYCDDISLEGSPPRPTP